MPRIPRDVPPPLELLCLHALWILREGNVKQVQALVSETRPLAYTTIMTVLERLVRKGKLTRRKAGRVCIYSPEASRDAIRRAAIRELVNSFFDGSEEDLIHFLRGDPESTRDTGASAPAGSPTSSGTADTIDTILL